MNLTREIMLEKIEEQLSSWDQERKIRGDLAEKRPYRILSLFIEFAEDVITESIPNKIEWVKTENEREAIMIKNVVNNSLDEYQSNLLRKLESLKK